MDLKKIAKTGAYLTTGMANLLHASYHLYAGALVASHTHGAETSHLAEKIESAMHHPAGQIAALSFIPIMAWDFYKHKKHNEEIKEYRKEIERYEPITETLYYRKPNESKNIKKPNYLESYDFNKTNNKKGESTNSSLRPRHGTRSRRRFQ